MIFIGLFFVIIVIVIGLNLYDSSNLDKIKLHFDSLKCENAYYAKGIYKGICEDKILKIENSFFIDIEKNSKIIYLKDIKEIDKTDFEIVLNSNEKLRFKEKYQTLEFYRNLQKKLGK